MKKLPLIIQIAILTILYVITAKIGQSLAIPPGNVTPLWPPSGLALASMLLFGYQVWPAIAIGSFINNYTVLYSPENVVATLMVGLFIAIGATLEALVGAYCLKKATGGINPIQNTYSAFIFILFSALLACVINATMGTTSLFAYGFIPPEDYWMTWLTWWLGDSTGVITITPTIILMSFYSFKDLTLKKLAEVLLLLIPLSIIGFWLLANYNQLVFMLIPFVLWAIFRLGSIWAFLISLFILAIAISYILNGYYLFGGTSSNQSSLLFQAFIAVVFIIDLFLSALLNEREKAYAALQKANDELEIKVEERTQDLSNALHELKHREAQLLQSEKMSSLGVLTAGIAHEINNPINFVYTSIQPLSQNFQDVLEVLKQFLELKPDNFHKLEEIHALKEEIQLDSILKEIPELLTGIKQGAERTAVIVKDLRTFSRLDEAEKKVVNVEEGLDVTVTLLAGQYQVEAVIKKSYGKVMPVSCYPGKLNQVFLNILTNAIEAIEGKNDAEITVRTWQPDPQHVSISIKDNGKGMTSEVKQKIFDPFFTTKAVGKGVGLGLTIAYSIIQEHQGSIEVISEPDKGAEFIITLPLE